VEGQCKLEFQEFPKIARLKREVIVTEKIDGANVAIVVTDEGDVLCQSRTKFITPQDDYKGFANWVEKNKKELISQLGYGIHYGEWWGSGLGRGYGLNEKRFSLFNTHQWHTDTEDCRCIEAPLCYVVPVLAKIDKFSTEQVDEVMNRLQETGSIAAKGFMNPEGIVVFHSQNHALYKVTYEYDATGKGQ
jgi:RNA ligase